MMVETGLSLRRRTAITGVVANCRQVSASWRGGLNALMRTLGRLLPRQFQPVSLTGKRIMEWKKFDPKIVRQLREEWA